MINKRLNFYYFGEIGEYNNYNPAYVCSKTHVSEILYLISDNEPFTIDKNFIIQKLNITVDEFNEAIESLKTIDAIEEREEKFRLKFPVFLEEDLLNIEEYLGNIHKVVGDKIIGMEEIILEKITELSCYNSFSKERLLYHIICDEIFDGTAFDFFEKKQIFSSSKPQPDNRDYMIIAYEDNDYVERHSNKLLCSSNNYRNKTITFNSFGDLNGARKDMYRTFRLIQSKLQEATPYSGLNIAYTQLIGSMNSKIVDRCEELILNISSKNLCYDKLSEEEKSIAKFLQELNYIEIKEKDNSLFIKVPLFKNEDINVIKDLSDIILYTIYGVVADFFNNFKNTAKNLTPMIHGVNINEVANEMWHQIFGYTNEYLVKCGFVQEPEYKDGQGRYLQAIYCNNR